MSLPVIRREEILHESNDQCNKKRPPVVKQEDVNLTNQFFRFARTIPNHSFPAVYSQHQRTCPHGNSFQTC